MKIIASALIMLVFLSVITGVSLKMYAQQSQVSPVSINLQFIVGQKTSEVSINIKVIGEPMISSVKSLLGGPEVAENLLSDKLNIPRKFVRISYEDKEINISLKSVGSPPPNDGIDFIVQEEVSAPIAALLEKLGLSGVPINLSIAIMLPKGAEIRELKISLEKAFDTQVDGTAVIISSKSPLILGKTTLSLYLRYSIPGSKRVPGE
ncbi:MAG TPA: hypothetical protein EYP68_08050 [Candidatus Korarchaeota archaeon]|nr:hypothetical protein [Candidatus Korarchaeota archaeon]